MPAATPGDQSESAAANYIAQPSLRVGIDTARQQAARHINDAVARLRPPLSSADAARVRLLVAAAERQTARNEMARGFKAAWSALIALRGRGPRAAGVGFLWWLGSPQEYDAIATQLDNAWARLVADAAGSSAASFVAAERQAWAIDSERIHGSLMQRLWVSTGRALDAWEARYEQARQRVAAATGRPTQAPSAAALQDRSSSISEDLAAAAARAANLAEGASGSLGLGVVVAVGAAAYLFLKKG